MAGSARIAIVAAMPREVRPLLRGWASSNREHEGRRFRFFESESAVVVCGGIGADAARRACEAVISLYRPMQVVSAGFAGALEPSLKAGDVVSPHWVIDAADGSRMEVAGGDGALVSFATVAGPEQKAKLAEAYGAQAIDMEAAAVGRAAQARGARFRAVKAISDESGFGLPPVERFVDSAGRFHSGRFAVFVAVRPWLWESVLRLARNSSKASRALCAALAKLEVREFAETG